MGCASCSSGTGGSPMGCENKGHCTSGRCNKMNTYDWLSQLEIYDKNDFDIVEVSFKNGARKEFFKNELGDRVVTGDMVVVDTGNGYDVGRISLSGELVRIQMKKKRVNEDRIFSNIIRRAHHRDLEKLQEARNLEKMALVRARVIARTLGLEMKIGDVEYQGDKRKATFYYTADGRVDFRELVKQYAKEFRVKIEMRQIGSRQESARIGGIGSCGRELCCSTWLSDFKTVSTSAARYQYIGINQSKLSGQCGRLKCCLNYELDTYMDALRDFPKKADYLKTKFGSAQMIKIDIFKGLMYYGTNIDGRRGPVVTLDKEQVKKILEMNKKGEYPDDLMSLQAVKEVAPEDEDMGYGQVDDVVELPETKKRRRGRGRSRGRGRNSNQRSHSNGSNSKSDESKSGDNTQNQATGTKGKPRKKKRRNNRKRGGNKSTTDKK
ncbi:PSP1 domain-containing protein [Portibacter marinus]|uniref:PSP1 domain-containing protein n=1 Tax=Portibacter marinus TaxID=2898660 RepID=UPI001F3FF3F2|nr:regulatory iron-sulfur-containing complex subunit RicT [Portibacter marinus]